MRGRFVVLVGPDGVGKTTVAQSILALAGENVRYFHFLPAGWESPMAGVADQPKPPRGMGWLRFSIHVLEAWRGYWRWIRPELERGRLVIGDRWLYGYAIRAEAFGFNRNHRLLGRLVGLAPRPDLVALLVADSSEIASRKSELTAAEAESQMSLWWGLRAPRLGAFSTQDPPNVVAGRILASVSYPAQTPA